MKTARLVCEPEGFAGPAKCFLLDPPLDGHQHVTVFTNARGTTAETVMIPAREDGTAITMARLPGSLSGFIVHEYALFVAGYELKGA